MTGTVTWAELHSQPEAWRRLLDRLTSGALALPVSLNGHELTVGATIGVAVYPGDGDTAEALLKSADAAMYSAKESGRGTHAFYRASMNQRAESSLPASPV